MIYLKEYNNYDNEVAEICNFYEIQNWSIRDGLVDVDDDVELSSIDLTELPLKFGIVSGSFNCSYNDLTSLKGSPKKVGGDFSCSRNYLTSLIGGPTEVGDGFDCSQNNLTSLKGAPKEVNHFDCSKNKLKSLEHSPEIINSNLFCSYNGLKTLEHFPKVKLGIYLTNNPLPKEILSLSVFEIKKVIEEQDFYEIWRDGELFLPRWRELKIDIGI